MGLTAGILIILMSIAHIVYGEKKQIPALKDITNDSVMIGSLRVMIYQGGFILLGVGIVQLAVAVNWMSLTGMARYFPACIVAINFVTALLITILNHREVLKITLPQFVTFLIILTLQLLAV